MAKVSSVNRNAKRVAMATRDKGKRSALKNIVHPVESSAT